MSSIVCSTYCPQCNHPEALELYSTHSVTITCHRCGYVFESGPETDDDGEFKTGDDGAPSHATRELKGYGAYSLRRRDGRGEIGTFNEPIRPETIAEFERALLDPETDADNSYLTRWDEEAGCVRLVAGRLDDPPHDPPDEPAYDPAEELELTLIIDPPKSSPTIKAALEAGRAREELHVYEDGSATPRHHA